MNSKELKSLEAAILSNTNDDEASNKLAKSMIKSSIVYLSIAFVLLVISLFVASRASLISIISPLTYYFIAIILILYLAITMLLCYKKLLKPTLMLLYYKIYDIVGFILFILVSIGFLFIFIMTPTTVIGPSMDKTLANGDKVFIWHIGYEPKRNDIVVAHVDNDYGINEVLIIKRVVAVCGDKVELRNNNDLYINDEFVTSSRMDSTTFNELTSYYGNVTNKNNSFIVPKNAYILLGDNRPVSNDSRSMGLIRGEDIIGKAVFRILPFNKIGGFKENKVE